MEKVGEDSLQLVFDFGEPKAEPVRSAVKFKTFDNPQNENEKLFVLQERYFNGDKDVLGEMFLLLVCVGKKLVSKELYAKKMKASRQKINDWATDAAILVIEQIQKNDLVVQTSWIAYLRLQVLKAMFYTTKSEQFEKFCVKHNLNLFELTEDEKVSYKRAFEKRR